MVSGQKPEEQVHGTSQFKPSRYVRCRCGRLMEVAIDVSRDILSKRDGSSQGSTLYPRVLMMMGLKFGFRGWLLKKWQGIQSSI